MGDAAAGTQHLVLELPYLLYRPPGADATLPVLLFLHGIGEGHIDAQPGRPARLGHQNLHSHGPPKLLAPDRLQELPVDHPLRTRFIVVSPQLPDRDTPWGAPAVVAALQRILAAVAPGSAPRVYVAGFSKGGRGAFEVAGGLPAGAVRAILALDAAPLEEGAGPVFETMVRPWLDAGRPAWFFHTDSLPGIVALHKLAREQVPRVDDLDGAAPTLAQLSTYHPPPAGVEPHGWLCEETCRDPRAWQWLLAQ